MPGSNSGETLRPKTHGLRNDGPLVKINRASSGGRADERAVLLRL